MNYISPQQKKAKEFASKKGYKLRKLKEGRIRVTHPNGSETVAHDWSSALEIMIREAYKSVPVKNIFER